jgi:hypothetical protein
MAVQRGLVRNFQVVAGSHIDLFVDHKNLIEILDINGPYLANKPQPGHNRLVRLCWFFLDIPHTFHYLPGTDNGRADLLSRLEMYPSNQFVDYYSLLDVESPPLNRIGALALGHAVRTIVDEDWNQPAVIEIKQLMAADPAAMATYRMLADANQASLRDGLYYMEDGRALIPDVAQIRARILVVLHGCGFAHRSFHAAWELARGTIHWPGLRKDLETFCRACIACVANADRMTRRPWGKSIAPQRRNDILAMDFLHLGPSDNGNTKVLVLSDKLTNYTRLFPVTSENATSTTHAVMNWISSFGVPRVILADRSPAFVNQVLNGLTQALGVDYNLTVARGHTGAAKIERVNKALGQIFRRLLFEAMLDISQWEIFTDVVQAVFNFSPTEANGGFSPLYAFVGLDPPNPMHSFLELEGAWTAKEFDLDAYKTEVSDLATAFLERETFIHHEQEQLSYLRRVERNAKVGVEAANFPVGTFVMLKNHLSHSKHDPRWLGPYRVLNMEDDGNVALISPVGTDTSTSPKSPRARPR